MSRRPVPEKGVNFRVGIPLPAEVVTRGGEGVFAVALLLPGAGLLRDVVVVAGGAVVGAEPVGPVGVGRTTAVDAFPGRAGVQAGAHPAGVRVPHDRGSRETEDGQVSYGTAPGSSSTQLTQIGCHGWFRSGQASQHNSLGGSQVVVWSSQQRILPG